MTSLVALTSIAPPNASQSAQRQISKESLGPSDLSFLALCRRAAEEARRQRWFNPAAMERAVESPNPWTEFMSEPSVLLQRLVLYLRSTMDRAPRFHHPSAVELSFDEIWLIAVHQAFRRDDRASFDFLLRSRIQRREAEIIGENLVFVFLGVQSGELDVQV